ncbi:MAG: efflux RND transporter periplasmic adaptor subunit [bacterium]|nr:efflux RND transporter periplasmic adaptor subunit [bacterium]
MNERNLNQMSVEDITTEMNIGTAQDSTEGAETEAGDLQEIVLETMEPVIPQTTSMTKTSVSATKVKKEHKAGKAILHFLKKIRVLLIILILAAIGVILFLNYRKKQDQMAAMAQSSQIETAEIEMQDLTTSITTTGTVKSMESRVIKSALTKTELSEVDVEIGDTVEAGQVVAIFKDEDIRTDIARIEDKINVSEQTEAIETQATDREYVYTYGTQALSITEAQQKVDSALKALYEACDGYGTAKRKLQAAKDEGKSDAEITQLETAVSSAYQTEIKAQETYETALQTQTSTLRSAGNTLASTDENYQKSSLTKGDSTEELQQQLEDLQTSLNNCVVTAPIGGVVTSLAVKTGDTYVEGEIMTIQNCDMFTVSAQIDEYDISDLKEGMQVVIKTDATRDDELEGVVSFISPTATASTGSSTDATYEVTIDILTQDDRLKLGMTAKLNIIVDEIQDVLTVPYDAVSTNVAGESVVYVVEAGVPGSHARNEAGGTAGAGGQDKGDIENTSAAGIEAGASAAVTGTETPTMQQKEVVVEIGMESDYYTQIISDELSAGMVVVIPSAAGEGGSSAASGTFGFGGIGGGMGGGGAPGGGGPGGGGMP